MRVLLTIACLWLPLLAVGPVTADDKILRIGTEGAYPPFNFVDEKGKLSGFDVDIAKALCKEMAVECEFVVVPWATIIDDLESGKFDLMVASMAYTDERAQRVAFSDPYYRSHAVFVGDVKKFFDIRPEALTGARIAAGAGTMQADYLEKIYAAKNTIVITEDQPGAHAALQEGKVDLILADAIELMSFLDASQDARFDFIGDPVTNDLLQSTSHITARKSDAALLENTNAALKRIRLNGVYDKVNDTYFPFSIF